MSSAILISIFKMYSMIRVHFQNGRKSESFRNQFLLFNLFLEIYCSFKILGRIRQCEDSRNNSIPFISNIVHSVIFRSSSA